MKLKAGTVIAIVLIFGALAYGAGQFVTNLTPYVSFQEAKAGKDRVFQVMGPLDRSQPITYTGVLNFTIKEEKTGQTLPVRFKKSKPANFDQATQVTAIGKQRLPQVELQARRSSFFGREGSYALRAVITAPQRQLLVKCPSKYEEEVKAD